MQAEQDATKKCPYCQETIKASAVKCRFCGEFLAPVPGRSAGSAPAAAGQAGQAPQPDSRPDPEGQVLWQGRPSLAGLWGTYVRGGVLLLAGLLLAFLPPEWISGITPRSPDGTFVSTLRLWIGLILVAYAAAVIVGRTVSARAIAYRITADRIEWERGVFSRRVDNLDMFRITDQTLKQSAMDRLLGIGTIRLLSADKTDPAFELHNVRDPRRPYDLLKKLSLLADRRQRVVHVD